MADKHVHGLYASCIQEKFLITTVILYVDWDGNTMFNKEKKNQCFHRNNFSWDFLIWLWHTKMMKAHSDIFQWPDLFFSVKHYIIVLFSVNQVLDYESELLGSVLGLMAVLCIWHFIAFSLTLSGILYYF